MYDLATIKRINEEARATAIKNGTGCVVFDTVEEASYEAFRKGTKNIDHAPEEYLDREDDLIDTLFVDHSGFGKPSEPALTQEQLFNRLQAIIEEHGPIEVGITEMNQFQLYVGVWPFKGDDDENHMRG
ncbi:hypothetical protein LCGC14_0146480 [marine sediment metagenome]|uniref:Uncharacterized protein n=1 Tax=marine sediment metagenome TaxID=412755 RepID=A0A0F9VFG5_9ZZZZ